MKNIIDRLEALSFKEPNSGCWIWEGSSHAKGYGHVWYKGSNRKAHRVSYEAFNGAIPDGKVVMHKCDNPACINPSHLVLGTNQDNMDDRNSKSRHAHGSRHGFAKINEKDAEFIRNSFGKLTKHQLKDMFGITYSTVCNILAGRIWKHV